MQTRETMISVYGVCLGTESGDLKITKKKEIIIHPAKFFIEFNSSMSSIDFVVDVAIHLAMSFNIFFKI